MKLAPGTSGRAFAVRGGRALVVLAIAALQLVLIAGPATAATFVVDTTDDLVDTLPGDGLCASSTGSCTLRAAVMEANALGGAHNVVLPPGTFTLSLPGLGEDLGATGDLDVLAAVTVVGDSAAQSVVDASGVDRVFDVGSGAGLTLLDLTVRGGVADEGAGIRMGGTALALHNTTVLGNVAARDGGGILVASGSATIESSSIHQNSAGRRGGGLSVAGGSITLSTSTVRDNTATGKGGGVDVRDGASATITRTTVSGNTSGKHGGGLYTLGTTSVTNSTISGNTAVGHGGGIFQAGTTISVTWSTVTANTGLLGGGLSADNATVTGTVVASNSAPGCRGTILSGGHNIDSGTTCAFAGPGDLSSTDPQLSPLASNGGPTLTHAIDVASPALDAGPATCLAVDQRGTGRPIDGDWSGAAACDIGAFELDPPILNAPPVLDPVAGITADELTAVTFTATATDPDGDQISYTLTGSPPAGAAIHPTNGKFTWTPTENQGPDVVTVTVRATDNGTPTLWDQTTVTLTINEVNQPPTLTDDEEILAEDTSLLIDVLANDFDVNGDALEVSGVGQPGEGITEPGGDGLIRYTPPADWSGMTEFTYTVEDGHGGTATAIVTVTVLAVNDDPLAASDKFVLEDYRQVVLSVLNNDNDVDGDALTVQIDTTGINGTAAVNDDGTITYQPEAGWVGVETFTYRVEDGRGGFAEAQVRIDVGREVLIAANAQAEATSTQLLAVASPPPEPVSGSGMSLAVRSGVRLLTHTALQGLNDLRLPLLLLVLALGWALLYGGAADLARRRRSRAPDPD